MSTQFKPTQEMIGMAEAVFMAMAWSQTVRPVVKKNQQTILDANNFQYEDRHPEIKQREQHTGKITNIDHDWLMSDADFLTYHNQVQALNTKAGLKVDDPECCPLLVAENKERIAKRELCYLLQPITGIDPDSITMEDHRNTLIELTLKLLAPYCRSTAALMKDLTTVKP